ncbi:hypothetical protein JCM33374_g3939 [Metschnikowia sp. JCM 33374]|nr:hypothetical protein JCM33374_g3939 [Metschnikowia sp. JCM 33374]
MSEILQHKIRIKEWERNFASKHGKAPSKADVKADVEIWKAYKAYNDMKKKSDKATKQSGKPSSKSDVSKHLSSQKPTQDKYKSAQNTASEQILINSVDVPLTDDEDIEPIVPVQNAELGPTPQANGKVLSIFDLILSPPESSPIKQNPKASTQLLAPAMMASASPFKTPTKSVKRINFGDLTPSRGPSIAEKLRLASSPSRNSETPKSIAKNDIIETPRYLGKVNSKFSFSEHDSPSRASPSKQRLFQTPVKPPSAENFQVSPSPLKSQRFLSKKLSDIFAEHQNLVMDEEFEAQKREFEQEFVDTEDTLEQTTPTEENLRDMRKRKKATTQKRTTRRWKIKPRTDGEQGESFDGKNVHEEIEKIETRDRSHLAEYIEGQASAEELSDDEDEEIAPRKVPASTKINPVSNNYQRLKINDPRAKKFKQRMRRR